MTKFSAILTNYNHSKFLPDALKGILGQTRPFDEIIVVDDGSTDNSIEVINNLIKGIPQARLVQNPKNMGVIPTLNVGLKEAKGEYIFYVAADDSYSNRILELSEPIIDKNPDVAMVSGNARIHNYKTGEERVFILPFPQEVAVYSADYLANIAQKRNVTFYGGANLIKKSALEDAGGFLAPLKWHADWFLYLVVALRNKFAVVPEELVKIRVAEEQYSHACFHWKTQKPVIAEFVRILKKDYPNEFEFLRNNAILPTYDPEALPLLLGNKELGSYLTPLLIWRLLSYKPLRAIGRLMPEKLRGRMRLIFRV